MFIITLNLTEKKDKAGQFMAAHNEWIAQGFAERAFLLVGSLKPQNGGAIIAVANDRLQVEARVAADPLVREGIAVPHIQEIAPARTDSRLSFLQDSAA
ncbi:YciI family protein [Parasphingorhabdus litoris]|uniref:YciI family protein n=1 Tax=Parasphingorhabdus litoris TaxID=394733 RepID=A0ABP3JUB5_9SPHN|nr:YciI family protein [Parasphingorhabdus litoris]